MKLPGIRPAAAKEVKPGDPDPKAPHHFNEVGPGMVQAIVRATDTCALCGARATDKIHIVEEQSSKWGM